jgi:hypothetical protein
MEAGVKAAQHGVPQKTGISCSRPAQLPKLSIILTIGDQIGGGHALSRSNFAQAATKQRGLKRSSSPRVGNGPCRSG